MVGLWAAMGWQALARPQVVPTGFTLETVGPGLARPIALTVLPDERVLVGEQAPGNIKVWVEGQGTALIGTVPDLAVSYSQGLLAIAIDPAFPTRPYLYTWFNHLPTSTQRVVRWEIQGALTNPLSTALTLGSPYLVLSDIPDQNSLHNGGSLRFLSDGTLLVSLGDDASCCQSQALSTPHGKLLRLEVNALPSGAGGPPPRSTLVPLGHPFSGPGDWEALIHATGLRNPFRIQVDPLSADILIADVGEIWKEEINLARGGENFGWPHFEGSTPTPGPIGTSGGISASSCGVAPSNPTAPLVEIPITSTASTIALGVFRHQPGQTRGFGSAYDGSFFYVDHFAGQVRRLVRSGSTWIPATPVPGQPTSSAWATGITRATDGSFGPSGALYWIHSPSSGVGSLNRIRPANRTLTALSGQGQAVNAGTPLLIPLAVRLADANGTPLAGVPIQFTVTAGTAVPTSTTTLTDASGVATLAPTPTSMPAQNLVISATSVGATSVVFTMQWRGLEVVYSATTATLTAAIAHSAGLVPFTLALDLPTGSPYFSTPFGSVWIPLFSSPPPIAGLDGLGLLGPADPSFATDSTGRWSLGVPFPPAPGLSLLFQAYAFDPQRASAPDAWLVSNPVTLSF